VPKSRSLWANKILLVVRTLAQLQVSHTRLRIAAVTQTLHWDLQIARLRSSAKSGVDRANLHTIPDWNSIGHPRNLTLSAMTALMLRTLPFEWGDLVFFIKWILQLDYSYTLPISALVRALQRYATANEIDPELRDFMRRFVTLLSGPNAHKEIKRLGTTLAAERG
jgi:hypothetical protein